MPHINHDNYETWLMLYLDNELTAQERQAVEAFVAAHPALQDELEGLKETLLQPEMPAAMPGLERLLMPEEWDEDALSPRQRQLLLMADGELNAAGQQEMKEALAASPLLQKEWQLLQQTILPAAPATEIPGKERLYRREQAKVVGFTRIIRFAAAAAVLGFGWFIIGRQGIQNTLIDGPEVVQVQPSGTDPVRSQNAGEAPASNTLIIAETENQAVLKQIDNNGSAAIAAASAPAELRSPARQAMHRTMQEEAPAQSVTAAIYEREVPSREPVAQLPVVSYVDIAGIDPGTSSGTVSAEAPQITTALFSPENTAPARYEVIDIDEDSGDEHINIAGARINKQKIRGVYRNITRPIARTFDKSNVEWVAAK